MAKMVHLLLCMFYHNLKRRRYKGGKARFLGAVGGSGQSAGEVDRHQTLLAGRGSRTGTVFSGLEGKVFCGRRERRG